MDANGVVYEPEYES